MNVHKNARLTPPSRAEMVRRVLVEGQRPRRWPRPSASSAKTVRKWVDRFAGRGCRPAWRTGPRGRIACTGRPRHQTVEQIDRASPPALDRQADRPGNRRLAGHRQPRPQALGLSRIRDLDPAAPVIRYEREHPGEMIHLDIKKLGRFDRVGHRITGDRTGQSNSRGIGWEFVHVCIDDASRIAFSQIMPDEKKESAIAFLKAALAYYASLGVTVARVMTDNGSCYKSFDFRDICRELGSSTSAPGPTRPRPTARPSASSRPGCANGPTPRPIPPQTTAPPSCPSGCIDTTGIGRTAG